MIGWYEWIDRRRERARQRMVARVKFPERDEGKEGLLRLNTLKEWGIIGEDEYSEGMRSLENRQAPTGRAWELRAEVRARDRRRWRRHR